MLASMRRRVSCPAEVQLHSPVTPATTMLSNLVASSPCVLRTASNPSFEHVRPKLENDAS